MEYRKLSSEKVKPRSSEILWTDDRLHGMGATARVGGVWSAPACLAMLCLCAGAAGQGAPTPTGEVPVGPPAALAGHLVNEITVRYMHPGPGLPNPEELLNGTVELVEGSFGLEPPGAGRRGTTYTLRDLARGSGSRLSDRGLAALAPAVVQRMKDLGFSNGVYVVPDPAQFAVEEGRVADRRGSGVTSLTLEITTGLVTQVTTTGIGEGIGEDQKTNHPRHAWIRAHSPVQAGGEGGKNVLRSVTIEDYALRLSRFPWRRVDSVLSSAGTEPGAVALDYLVTENKPWTLLAQVSNTGTASTSHWREHFAFVHNDLTNHDDVLTIGYQTANFQDSHSLYGSYERPVDADRLWRVRVFGQWYTYDASEVGFSGSAFEGTGFNVGAEARWNFFQEHALFLDAIAGAQLKHVSVDNNLALISGDDNFFVPHARLHLERHRETDRTDAEVGLEFNVSGIAGTSEPLDALGRTGAKKDWVMLKGNVSHSFFLNPLFDQGGLTHEVFFSLEGQHALGTRLVPNETMIAGGLYSVRGYPEAVSAGDSVILATAEYRYHIPAGLAPRTTPGTLLGQPFRARPQFAYGPTDWDWTLKAFVDVGRTINSDRQTFETDHTLVGAGIGTEISYKRNLSLRLDWGFALHGLEDSSGNKLVDSGDNRLHAVLTVVY